MCGLALSWRMSGPATSNWGRFLWISLRKFGSRGCRKLFTCCMMIFFKSICHKLHTSFTSWCSRPSWFWVIVYDTTTMKTISPPWNCTTVHCELTINFIQSTVGFLPRKVSILLYDLWSAIVTVLDTLQQHKHNNEQGPFDVLRQSSENSWDTIPDCRILFGKLASELWQIRSSRTFENYYYYYYYYCLV